MLELLQYPFVQRAIIAGIILAALFAWLGVFVTVRQLSFFGEGISHASLAGIAIGLLLGLAPLFPAIIVAIIFATLMFLLERKTNIKSDALIGILFTSFMAIGVILLSFTPGYQPELVSYLFGSILAIGASDLFIIGGLSALIMTWLAWKDQQLTLLAFDRELAFLKGIKSEALDLAFYIVAAITVVLGVKMLGIILVSALLIIPASVAKVFSKSFSALKINAIIVGEVVVIGGLLLSLAFNLPTGPSIILIGAGLFLLAVLFRRT